MSIRKRVLHKVQRIIEGNVKYDGSIVLMFHSVADSCTENNDVNYMISKEHFSYLLEELDKSNYNIVDINSFIDNYSKYNILLTFDDANSDIYENAFPILKAKKIPYVVFQNVEYIDREGFLNSWQIKKMMDESLMTLGSHAVHHKIFAKMNRNVAKRELKESKEYLEKTFETKIKYFAFPYGGLSQVKLLNVIDAFMLGYKAIFLTIAIRYRKGWGIIPRINVSDNNFSSILKDINGSAFNTNCQP